MTATLLWLGPAPPDAVTGFAARRGLTLRTAAPQEGADAVARHSPELIFAGVVDADVADLRAAAPTTPIAYCPPATTADGVSDATAAGADVVLPQDADAWAADELDRRLPDAAAKPSPAAGPVADGGSLGAQGEAASGRGEAALLDRLDGVTGDLFDAETPEAVAEIVCEALREGTDLDTAVVRLYDSRDETLRVVATSDAADLLADVDACAVGEGVAGTAFSTGEPQVRDDLEAGECGELGSAVCFPLGDHGTVGVGSTTADAFDAADVSLVRLLSTTATAAVERVDRETRLRRQEAVLESRRGMVFAVDQTGIVDYVSEELAERLGTPAEDVVGEHAVEFVDVTEFSRAESLLEEGEEASVDVTIRPLSGDSFPARVDLSVFERGADGTRLVGVVEDRSTLPTTREDLRREHERLWTLFENLPDPVVDAEHAEDGPVVRAANDAFAEVFDCDREAIVGKSIDDVLASPAGDTAGGMPPEVINEQVREGEVTGAKVRRETKNGTRTFLFRGIPYAEDGGVRAFGIYTDVTEIERRERHVKVLDRLLRHNLRNDLGVVIGRAENVLEHSSDPEVRTEAAELVEAANQLVDLSDTAKRIRRIIEEPSAPRSGMPVTDLFEEVVADARANHPEASVSAEAADEGLEVLGTSDLRLALEELVENAILHGGDAPSVELRAEAFAPASTEWVDLFVTDDGPGIPETERAAVTGDRDITQLDHGSGLGLWLVRWAVESVGGDLAFERRDGRTAVRLRLRRADAE